jgi:hypothetical protein
MASDLDARAFTKRKGHLVPSDIMADDMISRIKEGGEVLVSIRRARNPRHHRLLFAALNKVVENCDQWPSVEALLDELKLATGHAEVRVNLLTGKPYAVPASINFASMPQDKFAAWFDQVVGILATKALNVAPEALRAEIMLMVEDRRSVA